MNEIVNLNEVLSSTVTTLIQNAFNKVCEKATTSAKDAWTKIFEDFEPFMQDAYKKNSYVRLLSQKEKDAHLYDVYVTSSFKCGDLTIDDTDLINNINEGRNVVINGNGGAGKTFFMRHLWLTLFKNQYEYTPIFIELRKLNDLTSIDLKSFIRITISRKKELSDDIFSYFCNTGRFCFILDGFDEVVNSERNNVQNQILQMCSDYPNCSFVVSSRYEKRFAGWHNFELFESKPFDLKKVRTLIEKVPFDQTARKLFLKQLDEDFYNDNESFLSNPLLAIMMMMTFKENMDIPRRMNIFYDQAFTTLFQWHDATKAFNRAKTLDIEAFQRSFGMFCLLSYHQEKFEFTHSEVIELINKSNKICDIKASPEEILKDYEETVNLLRQEGLKYVFIHRSFQEYFCAYAIIRLNHNKFSDIFNKIRKRHNDNVLLMCFEMNRDIVIDNYINPLYEKTERLKTNKSKNAGLFKLASDIQIKLSMHTTYSTDSKCEFVGIGIDMHDDIDELINNTAKLMGHKVTMLNHSWSILLNETFFPTMNTVLNRFRINKNLMFDITFAEDEINVLNIHDTSGKEINENQRKMLSDFLNKNKNELLFVEEALQKKINLFRKWCEKEIDKSSKREKSLDDILGL